MKSDTKDLPDRPVTAADLQSLVAVMEDMAVGCLEMSQTLARLEAQLAKLQPAPPKAAKKSAARRG
jgi:hypothetical protein